MNKGDVAQHVWDRIGPDNNKNPTLCVRIVIGTTRPGSTCFGMLKHVPDDESKNSIQGLKGFCTLKIPSYRYRRYSRYRWRLQFAAAARLPEGG